LSYDNHRGQVWQQNWSGQNCTSLGCGIETRLGVTIGTFVHIAIPYFADVSGWVAWSSLEAIDIDFCNPIPTRVLEYIVDQNIANFA
jgi:hypothetical protein